MYWILIIGAVFLVIVILVKLGNNEFWQTANKNPLIAYSFFLTNDCWFVINPLEDKSKPTDGEWLGPFFLLVPHVGRVKIYGKKGEIEQKQKEFLEMFN